MNRKSVMLCINKYRDGGIDNAMFNVPGRGRNAEITDDEKAMIINIACQKPTDFTQKHGSCVNLVEGFFSKMTKQMLRGIRIKTKEEHTQRIYQYFTEANAEPIVYH